MKLILIVEDEQNVRENLEDLLLSEGYFVVSAKDGYEGYSMALEYEPHLILSDVRMPKMDGLDLLKKLRGNPLTTTIPLIFLTASYKIQDIKEGLIIETRDFILKPFRINDVLNAINQKFHEEIISKS
jgi:CheY-like chemotaxis protein